MLNWKQERLITELKNFADALKNLSEFVDKTIISVENYTDLINKLSLSEDTRDKLPQIFITTDQSMILNNTVQVTFNTPAIPRNYDGEVLFIYVDQKSQKTYTISRYVVGNYINTQKYGIVTQTLIFSV